ATARDHRYRYRVRHRARQFQIEARLGAVAIHAREQDLARAEFDHAPRPFDRVQAGVLAAAVREDVPHARRDGLGVDRNDDALAADLAGRVGDELRVGDSRGVDADLVRTGVEQAAHVLDAAHAAADGQRDEDLVGDLLDDVQDDVARVGAGRDVEEGQFIGALLVVAARDLDRIAGVAQLDEVDALDDAPGVDVEAGN